MISQGASYVHRSVPNGLYWEHDGFGEGPPGPAPRQGRARAHPQRVTTAVPRSGHQPHRHGRTLRGGPGVQAHGLSALHQQGRTRHRIPAPIRSRHHARSVRPHRPHAPRTTPRRLRGAGVRDEDLSPLCPYIAAAVELHDPQHPASQYARDYKKAFAERLTETAREAGATNPEQLGEQLALLLDGASARTRVLNSESFPTAAAIAAVLIDNAIPTPSPRQPHDDRGTTGSAPVPERGQ